MPEPECAGGFHDQLIQERLLPFFVSGEVSVDPYDGGEFRGNGLVELRRNLEQAVMELGEQPVNWNVLETELDRYYQRGGAYGIVLLAPRDQAIADLNKALALIEVAVRTNTGLYFTGD